MGRPRNDSVESVKLYERRMRVLALRQDGLGNTEIAEKLDVPPATVARDVRWLRDEGHDVGVELRGTHLRAVPAPTWGRPVAAPVQRSEGQVRQDVDDRRVRGESVTAIARALDITVAEVRRHINEVARARRDDDLDGRRELELARLDRMLLALDAGIEEGNPKAINAAARIIAERAKLLGLYRPIMVEHTVITVDMIDAEMNRLNQELGRLREGVVNGEAVEVHELPSGPAGV
jgi:hypothetical protein